MRIDPEFPPDRVSMPMRRAEHMIYELLSGSGRPGHALYEARVAPDFREVDFLVWLDGVARYGIEVKGGQYGLDNDGWQLITGGSRYSKRSPVSQAMAAAASVRAVIEERLHRNAPIVVVLAFPDMEPDQVITHHAAERDVEVLFGTDHWTTRLEAVAKAHRHLAPPSKGQIVEEVLAVASDLAGQIHPRRGDGGAEGADSVATAN